MQKVSYSEECPVLRIEWDSWSKFATGSTLPERRDALQKADIQRMRFSKSKCKFLHLCCGNTHYIYIMMEHSHAEKDLGVLVHGSWT